MSLAKRRAIVWLSMLVLLLAACGGTGTATQEPDDSATPAESPDGSGGQTGGDDCNIVVNDEGQLEPLADGFPNQPFTLINADDPGSPDGIYALEVKRAIEENQLTDQRVTVVDRPDFGTYGTWEVARFLEEEPGGSDGYIWAIQTIPGSTTDLLTTQVVEDLGAQIEDTNIVLGTEYVPYVLVSRKDAPWGNSFRELIEYTQQNPDEVRLISRGPGSGLDLAFNHYSALAAEEAGLPEGERGIPVEVIVGGSHQEINATVGSGEGDITMTLADVAKQFNDDGRNEILTFSGNAPAPPPFEDVPTAKETFGEELLPNDPWGQNRNIFVAQSVPECHRLWLAELINQVVAQPEFQEARSQVPGLTIQIMTREELFDIAEVAYEEACQILKPLDLLDPSMQDAC